MIMSIFQVKAVVLELRPEKSKTRYGGIGYSNKFVLYFPSIGIALSRMIFEGRYLFVVKDFSPNDNFVEVKEIRVSNKFVDLLKKPKLDQLEIRNYLNRKGELKKFF